MSKRRPGFFVNFLVRALVGMTTIFLVNQFLAAKGVDINVGLNGISLLTSGILGIPGVALLYGIVGYQIL